MSQADRKFPQLVLIGGISLGGFVALMGAGAAVISPMLFDAPGSDPNPWLWTMVIGIWSAPLLGLLGPVGCGIGLWMERKRRWPLVLALPVALLPLLPALAVGVGILGLTVFCGGSFGC
ncbi:MAG: hypothetical protein RIT45_2114 [Pseudomonadota bacterium]